MPDLTPQEPVLPEHALIRDSAPLPELSAGFRRRVLTDVHSAAGKALRVRRLKQGTTVAATVCAALLLFMFWPESPTADEQISADQPPTNFSQPESASQITISPGHSDSISPLKSPGSGIAVDAQQPRKTAPDMMEQLIEDLGNRQNLFR